MVTLEAPFPTIEVATLLPNPELNDGIGNKHSFNLQRSMDGTKRTYIRTLTRKLLTFNFRLTRMKSLELQAFVNSYFSSRWRITDHLGRQFVGYLANNPFELQVANRALNSAGDDYVDVTIQFEGTQL
jgi:hypothetical protein